MFLHYLANVGEENIRMFLTQWKYRVKGDWTEQVKQDLKDFEISISLEELKTKVKKVLKDF